MNKRLTEEYIEAGSEDSTAKDLCNLAKSQHRVVRRRVAQNERTPQETLRILAKDHEADVRMAVALNNASLLELVCDLAADTNSDVRFRIASTSYLPKRLHKQLAEDENPYVAHRAKQTLALLENQGRPLITMFEFLSEDHAMLTKDLKFLVDEYPKMSLDQVFDKTVDVLDSIRLHLDRQASWCTELMKEEEPQSGSLSTLSKRCVDACKQLKEQISDLLFQHVDGPEFHTGLTQLLELLKRYTDLSGTELFVEMKKRFSPEQLDAVNTAINQQLRRENLV